MPTIPLVDQLSSQTATVKAKAEAYQDSLRATTEKLANIDTKAPDAVAQIEKTRSEGGQEAVRLGQQYFAEADKAKALGDQIANAPNLSEADKAKATESYFELQNIQDRSLAARQQASSTAQEQLAKVPEVVPVAAATSVPVADQDQKVAEAAAASTSTYGDKVPFEKLTANSPPIAELEAAQMKGKSLVGGSQQLIDKQIKASIGATESQPSASTLKKIVISAKPGIAHKVILKEVGTTNIIAFDVLPEIQESHESQYEAVAPSQFPGAFQKFKGTATTSWTLNVQFVSRTTSEAGSNYQKLMRLRGWMKPFFGQRTGQIYSTQLGAPPPVLELTGLRDLIGPVPVVMTSMNWTWPKDVDYISTGIESEADGNFIPFPTVMSFPIGLVESYSVEQFNNFSLEDYRNGRMKLAFNNVDSQTLSALSPGDQDNGKKPK